MCVVRGIARSPNEPQDLSAALQHVGSRLRPCTSNNGNLCEPYEFATHGEGGGSLRLQQSQLESSLLIVRARTCL